MNETINNQISNATIGVAKILKEVEEIKNKIKFGEKKSLSTGRLGTKTMLLANMLANNDHQYSKKYIHNGIYYDAPESDEDDKLMPKDFLEDNFKSDNRFIRANRKYRVPVRPQNHPIILYDPDTVASTKPKIRVLSNFQMIL